MAGARSGARRVLPEAGTSRPARRVPAQDIIDDTTMAQVMAGSASSAAAGDGGLDDEQAMRILMLLARPGRRISELLLLDFDPLLPLATSP